MSSTPALLANLSERREKGANSDRRAFAGYPKFVFLGRKTNSLHSRGAGLTNLPLSGQSLSLKDLTPCGWQNEPQVCSESCGSVAGWSSVAVRNIGASFGLGAPDGKRAVGSDSDCLADSLS